MIGTADRARPARVALTIPRLRVGVEVTALCVALGLGFVIRLSYVLAADFPLNDGGMFYEMIRNLQRAHYALPSFTSYNAAQIPFAYPPLGFYAAGILSDTTHMSLLTVLRVLPLLVNTLTIAAFFLFARSFLSSRAAAIASTLAFAVLPESFIWPLMGGGLTRSFGLLFSILAIHQVYLLYTRGGAPRVALTALLAGLAVLSHLEAAVFVAVSAAVMFLAYGRNRAAVRNSLLVAVGTLLITAPWWMTVIAHHGMAPLLAARATNGGILVGVAQLAVFDLTSEALFPVVTFLALLGVLACLRDRKCLVPIWLATLILLDPRSAPRQASVLLALLAGIGVAELLLPLLYALPHVTSSADVRGPQDNQIGSSGRKRTKLPVCVLALLLCYATLSAMTAAPMTLHALSHEDRAAMQWIADTAPRDSSFLVITGTGWETGRGTGLGEDRSFGWGDDEVSEWFPVLAGRVSVATPQGHEWFAGFDQSIIRYDAAQRCAARDSACLEDWARQTGTAFTHVYVSQNMNGGANRRPSDQVDIADQCCWALRESLRHDPGFALVYEGPGVTIFARQPAPTGAAVEATPDRKSHAGGLRTAPEQ